MTNLTSTPSPVPADVTWICGTCKREQRGGTSYTSTNDPWGGSFCSPKCEEDAPVYEIGSMYREIMAELDA